MGRLAQNRACFRLGEIHIRGSSGAIEYVIPFDDAARKQVRKGWGNWIDNRAREKSPPVIRLGPPAAKPN